MGGPRGTHTQSSTIAAAFTVILLMISYNLSAILVVVKSSMDCTTVTALVSTCANFITHGSPDPQLGSPCCNAVQVLKGLADSTDNRQSVCRCITGLVTSSNPNATAIATLPGLCGVFLGFTIDPTTDCNLIP